MSNVAVTWRALAAAVGSSRAGVDWAKALLSSAHIDPYMAWYEIQGWPGLSPTAQVNVLLQRRGLQPLGLPASLTYRTTIDSRVRSYRIGLNQLHLLQQAVERGEVTRFEVEVARGEVGQGLARAEGAQVSVYDQLKEEPPEKRRLIALDRDARRRASLGKPLVGIIDDTINFQHRRWRAGAGTPDEVVFSKLLSLWDQSTSIGQGDDDASRRPAGRAGAAPAGGEYFGDWIEHPGTVRRDPGSPVPAGPTYGRELLQQSLDKAAATDQGAMAYERYEYPRVRARRNVGPDSDSRVAWEMRTLPMREWTHGVAVAGVIDHEANGLPPHSIMFVSLPLRSTEDTSGGSLAGLALDAIVHFLSNAGERPLIVNLSYGTHQGPHDGTSLFETALDELLRAHPNLHVVLPAGNSHLSRTHQQALLREGECIEIPWKILPDDPTDSFMEVWCHHEGAKWEIELVPPGGLTARTAKAGEGWVLEATHQDGRDLHAALIFPRRPAQGLNGTMALVAIAPTLEVDGVRRRPPTQRPRRPRPAAPDGVWVVRIVNRDRHALAVHAWILRDDAAPGGTRAARGHLGRQSYVQDTGTNRADPASTISGIATLDPNDYEGRLIIAGALRKQDGGLSTYSAAGPTLDRKRGGVLGPNMVVTGDESINRPGLLVPGSFGRAKRRVAGTSLSAAVVAGQLFRHLQDPHATAADFCPSAIETPSTRPAVPEGSPVHAQDDLRGVHARFTFDPVNDRLDEPTKGLTGTPG